MKTDSGDHISDSTKMMLERLQASEAELSKAVIRIQEERDLAQAEFRTYHKAWEEGATRIKELEEAPVEERAKQLHVNCKYDQEFPCDYSGSRNGWCGKCDQRQKIRDIAYKHLVAEGEIGPDAKPRSWQITDERKKTLIIDSIELIELNNYYNDHTMFDLCTMLRAMLQESG